MPFAPPMTGNGKHATYEHGDDPGLCQDMQEIVDITPSER